ncbi:MAG: hypothetical protein AB7E31_12590, partial [Desulfitobacterium sp.]
KHDTDQVPFMHKIGSNNKPKIIGQFKIAESLAHQVIQRFFVFHLLKSGWESIMKVVASSALIVDIQNAVDVNLIV